MYKTNVPEKQKINQHNYRLSVSQYLPKTTAKSQVEKPHHFHNPYED